MVPSILLMCLRNIPYVLVAVLQIHCLKEVSYILCLNRTLKNFNSSYAQSLRNLHYIFRVLPTSCFLSLRTLTMVHTAPEYMTGPSYFNEFINRILLGPTVLEKSSIVDILFTWWYFHKKFIGPIIVSK